MTQIHEVATKPPAQGDRRPTLLAAGSVLGAIGASSCCIVPLLLFTVGISGAWIGGLTALAPYQPIIVTVTLVFLGAGFYLVYRKPDAADCGPGSYCANPNSNRVIKLALWGATVLVIAAALFPYVLPLLLKN